MLPGFLRSNPPAAQRRPSPRLGLYVVLLGGFVTLFDLFVVNVAIPDIQHTLNASFAQVGFIVTGYGLAFGALLITGGRLGDIFGRRRLFIVGMGGFTLASGLCGCAPDAAFLIGARVAQGLAAALLFPQVYACIHVNFEGHERRRAFGLLGMTLGAAAIAGQVLGGWMVNADLFGLGWRSIFLINLLVGTLAMVAARFIPESRAERAPSLDGAGVALSTSALVCLLVPLIEGPAHGWPAWCIGCLVASACLSVLFYLHQENRRAAGHEPLIDMRLFRNRRFAMGLAVVLIVYSTSSSFFLCFALLMQSGLGLDPFIAGQIFAPCSVGFVAASCAAPQLARRWGSWAIVGGALVYTAAMGWLITQVGLAGADLVPVRLIPALVVVGAGQGLVMTPLLNLVLGSIDDAHAGMASGVVSTVQQVGAAIGVALVAMLFASALGPAGEGAVRAAHYASAFVAGMRYNLAAGTVVCLLLIAMARARAQPSNRP